jgi:hypothetical protein
MNLVDKDAQKNPFLHPNLGSNKLVVMSCVCHKNFQNTQKLSQGAHMNFIWALILYIFIFVRLEVWEHARFQKSPFCDCLSSMCMFLCNQCHFVFSKNFVYTCSCEVEGKAREVEEEGNSNQCLGHERRNWFKEQMHLELIRFATQIFKKFQLWNCKLQMVVVLMCCFCHVQLRLTIFMVVLAFLFLISLNW